ncbi:mesoderm posterior protein 1-like [Scomber scombrus]|nr:mesoderm posterior protein 1-like [Scomber scombrus]
MDVSYCPPLQLQENSFLFDCESLLDKSYHPLAFDPASDPGYFSAGSSLSPTSSVDSFCFSPTSLQANERDALDCFIFGSPAAPHHIHETQTLPCSTSSTTTSTIKKSRSRYPGKKRQTASEREKHRMRDLTKAMHHLRGYLPPSVAPAGQTLTKIDTLRLTIRYISYLSEQLGLSEEVLEQRSSSGFVEQPQTLNQFLGQQTTSCSSQESGGNIMNTTQLSSLQNSYQVPSGVCFNNQQYWMPQDQLPNVTYPGQC